LSLMRAARKETDYVVVSLFVNPLQFGPAEDFNKYPRDTERDLRLAEKEGVSIMFCPTMRMIYPPGFQTFVEVEGLGERLCGLSRPGHFRGVTTIVCKLFNIIRPDIAYFGQKDAQQAVIIQRMAEDLNMGTKIRVMPIIREEDGLAMSSRNVYLSPQERQSALGLYKAIHYAEELIKKGERDCSKIISYIKGYLESDPLVNVDYVCIVHPRDLTFIEKIETRALLALAVRIGNTRLIDNTIFEV